MEEEVRCDDPALDQCVQMHSGALERGHVIEHLYRDVRVPRI
ncbi:hypothetical protein ACWEKJ_29185 [Amycolatopsis thermoflava]|nr:hypothetical protein [Amycolatopsis tucumanensis]